LNHGIDFSLGLLAFVDQCLELRVHGVFSAQESVHEMFFDRETRLDGLFTRPVFSVRLALYKNLKEDGERGLYKSSQAH
jgi:hypothetical protein